MRFYMTIGLPASGKTTYANTVHNAVRVSSDDIRTELYGTGGYEKDEQSNVFKEVHRRVIDVLQNGNDVIFDATNISRKNRMEFLKQIKHIKCEKIAVLFLVDLPTLKRTNSSRIKSVPEPVYDRMLRNFDPPALYEGFDDIRVVSHLNMASAFPYCDIGILDLVGQDNHHHKDTLGIHMRKTREIFIEKYRDDPLTSKQRVPSWECLTTAALLHDVGKVITKSYVDGKGNRTDEAHYYGHEKAGSYLALIAMLPKYGPQDALYAANLINWHMRPFIWRKSVKAMNKDRALIGDVMFRDVVRIHMADILSRKG